MPHQAYFNLPEEKRKRIRQTALELFSTLSYDEVTTRMLAQRAGISMGSLYQYFESKDEMYLYFLDTLAYSQMEGEEFPQLWSKRVCDPQEVAYIRSLFAAPSHVLERYYYSRSTNIFRYVMDTSRELQRKGLLPENINLEMYGILYAGLTFSSLMYCRMVGITDVEGSDRFLKENQKTFDLFLYPHNKQTDS